MLKFIVDAVPEGQADLYTQEADGKFKLKVEGVVADTDYQELKTKLGEFRNSNNTLKRQLEELQGMDLIANATNNGKSVKDTIESLVQARIGTMKTQFETELKTAKTLAEQRRERLKRVQLNEAVKSAALEHGVRPEAVDDVLGRVGAMFEMSDGDELVPVNGVVDAEGKPLTVGTAVSTLKTKAGHLFHESKGTGEFGRSSANRVPTSAPKSRAERLAAFQKPTAPRVQ